MTVEVVRCRMVVSGRVQGVGYRYACLREADRLGVGGWVGNRHDGTVEVVAEGPRAAVDQLVEWCRHGPAHARVTAVGTVDETPAGLEGFTIVG